MRVLDLCAGTGSATQAFRDRGYEVETLDIVGDHTYVCDVRTWEPTKQYDFIWCSPPCTEFSIAKGIKCKDRKPDLSIVQACFKIAQNAQYWIVENPRGCLRYFIGKPTITIYYNDYGYLCKKATDLWGIFPFFWSTQKRIKTRNLKTIQGMGNMNRTSVRAMVPYGLSLAICKAIEKTPPVNNTKNSISEVSNNN